MGGKRILGTVLAAALAAALGLAAASPAFADETMKASELTSTDLVLSQDTVLVMDADATLTSISGAEFALEVQGTGALSVNNPDGTAIEVSAFSCECDVSVTAFEHGVYALGDVFIGGNVESAVSSGVAVYSCKGSIHIVGNAKASAGANGYSGHDAIYAGGGSLTIEGDVEATLNNPLGGTCLNSAGNMTLCGSVVARGGDQSIRVYPGVLTAYGDVVAENDDFEAIMAYEGMDFYGNVSATSPSFPIYNTKGGVRFHGGTVKVTATDGNGIMAYGDVVCDGADVTIKGTDYGIRTQKQIGVDAPGGIIVKSGRLDVTGEGYFAFCSMGEIQIDEPLGIEVPAGGELGIAQDTIGREVNSVVDTDGVAATHVVIVGPDPAIVRLAGDYANETAAKISAEAFPEGSEWVVIACDDDFADALGATGLAGALECPIVLTGRESLSEAAAAEVTRLGAKRAYVIGGTGAIAEQVDADLAALGVAVEPRVWGENSFDTSLACAKKIVELGGDEKGAVVAMSTNFQDALSFSPVAYKLKLPVVLQTWGATSADRGFTPEAAEWLADKGLFVIGGPGAISKESVASYSLSERIWGETGYDTSNEIAEWATRKGLLSDSVAVFACGAQAPKGVDALAGAALAGKLGCPVLLVNGNEQIESVDTTTIDGYFAGHALMCEDVYMLGGEYVMPQSIVDKILVLYPTK